MNLNRWVGAIFLCLVLFASRFIPHPDNFTPFLALSLFIGFFCRGYWWALFLPLVSIGLSDLQLGLYPGWAFVYIPFVLAVFLGFFLKAKPLSVIGFSSASSLGFFFISNFGVWLYSGLYPTTGEGLWACYLAAIPFFHKTFLSTLFYSLLIYSLVSITERLGDRESIAL